jgi:very-short-patch-repair endonuclease
MDLPDWLDDVAPLIDRTELPRVITRAEALNRGMARSRIDSYVRTGRWVSMLPGVYLTASPPSWSDRIAAAALHGGPAAMITGAAALHTMEFRSVRRPPEILVLVPYSAGARSIGDVRIRRTTILPTPQERLGPPMAPPARAVIDHVLGQRRIDDVRAVIAEAVQREHCSVRDIRRALEIGQRRDRSITVKALAEIDSGARSAPEARAASTLREGGVTGFEQDAEIVLPGRRRFIADFLWRKLRAVLEIDSTEYHFRARDYTATMRRDLALHAAGYSVIHVPPSLITSRPEQFVEQTRRWLGQLAARTTA